MADTVIPAAEEWYRVEPDDVEKPSGVRRTPIVAWRVGRDDSAVPIVLATDTGGDEYGVMGPTGAVWFRGEEYSSVRAFLDTYAELSGEPPPPRRGTEPAERSDAVDDDRVAPTSRLLDPELVRGGIVAQKESAAVALLQHVAGHRYSVHVTVHAPAQILVEELRLVGRHVQSIAPRARGLLVASSRDQLLTEQTGVAVATKPLLAEPIGGARPRCQSI